MADNSSSSNSANSKKCAMGDSVKETCPASIKDKSARSACEQINRDAAWAAAHAKTGKDFLTSVIDACGSRSESLQTAVNILKVNMSTLTQTDQESRCENVVNQNQLNLIEVKGIPPECLVGLSPEVKEKLITNSYVSDITQMNSADALNTCKINVALEALSQMDASIDTLTIQEAINKAKGLMSGSSSSQMSCNEIPVEMSACKYISQTQCCANDINQTQQNIIRSKEGCGSFIKNIVQSNKASAVNDCVLQASSSVTDKFAAKIKQTTTQAADNSSEGLTLDFLIILFAIFIFCVLAGAFVLYKYMSFSIIIIFFIIGGIFLLASIICLAVYFSTRKSSITRYNQPYTSCPTVRTFKSESVRKTLGEVKKRVESKDVIGYDFFMDLPIDNDTDKPKKPTDETPRNASNDTLGNVVYITIEPKASDICDFEDPQKLESAVISYIRGKSNNGLLWVGIVLLIASAGCIGFGSYKWYRNSNTLSVAKTNTLPNSFIPKSSIPTTSTNPATVAKTNTLPKSSIPTTSTNPATVDTTNPLPTSSNLTTSTNTLPTSSNLTKSRNPLEKLKTFGNNLKSSNLAKRFRK